MTRRAWIAVAVVVGCTSPRPPVVVAKHRRAVAAHEPPPDRRINLQGLPALDLRGLLPHDLPDAPVPHFATVRAQWPEICERRGRLADDVLAYVEIWCRGGQVGELSHLQGSAVAGLDRAVIADVVALLADATGGKDAALRVLAVAGAPTQAAEQLAEAYVARDRDDDARIVLVTAGLQSDRLRCQVDVRTRLAHFDRGTASALRVLRGECRLEIDAVECAIARVPGATATCAVPQPPLALGELPEARLAWAIELDGVTPTNLDPKAWVEIAEVAQAAEPYPGAAQIVASAMANARAIECASGTDTIGDALAKFGLPACPR